MHAGYGSVIARFVIDDYCSCCRRARGQPTRNCRRDRRCF